jgi:diguanylate cyclase (GGDEF)-like protein
MDAFTLVVAAALAAVIMAGSMGLVYLTSTRQACLVDWMLAGLFFACSNVLGAVGLTTAPAAMLLGGINAFHVAGHYGMLAGVRRHVGLASGWGWGLLMAAGVLAAHALPCIQNSSMHRLMLNTPFVCGTALAAVWLLLRHDHAARAVYLPLIVLEVLSIVQQAVRVAIMVASDGVPPSFLGGQFFRTSGALSMLVYLSIATMGCALIVAHQQTLALRRASLTDVLTGWLNRRALHDTAGRAFRHSRKAGTALYFITFDIDHFKAVNDHHGHGVGDTAICHVTTVAARVLHDQDALFRIGGEEFAVLIAGPQPDQIDALAEHLRAQVAATPLMVEGTPQGPIRMTISVGIAAMGAYDQQWEDILRRADEALYHAKQHGRNRVSVHGRDLAGRETQLQLAGT